ncbi:unnamed protein product (macronuclear) [Paramecium tetraurelia]|uniref:Uncharacterized protein n=1 Tax=Paramecium tetraurelia TaxID=5888 RepID=A0CKZ3_PARTE|nr:uncharacterized protein GSPATT00008007001 [Paramecium tetraurelia]CAK71460.1 unnamed protein product [Paramecium tetraurelia]|eukprot:XP_001438857.1 hypothetical protein (macronuclear) [Paramecium tetraurelia strain d4-2]
MQEELNSSLDSLELELYHKPNTKIKSILTYLRQQKIQFCTDPKRKEDNYYSKNDKENDSKDFGIFKNKFYKRKSSTHANQL